MKIILKHCVLPIICVVFPDDVRGVIFELPVQEAQQGAGDYHATFDNPTCDYHATFDNPTCDYHATFATFDNPTWLTPMLLYG